MNKTISITAVLRELLLDQIARIKARNTEYDFVRKNYQINLWNGKAYRHVDTIKVSKKRMYFIFRLDDGTQVLDSINLKHISSAHSCSQFHPYSLTGK